MWRTRARIGQIATYLSIVPLAIGVVSIVFAAGYDEFSNGMFWLLGGGVVAGLGFGWCIPLRARDRASVDDQVGRFWSWRLAEESAPSIRTLARDLLLVWVAFVLILAACVVIGATMLPDFDGSIFSFVAVLPLVPVLGAGGGMFLGMLLIGPIWDIPMQVADGRDGPNALKLSIALVPLFLLIFGFAVVGAFAVHDDLGPSGIIGAGRQIFTVLTGIPLLGISIVNPGLAWLARLLALPVVIAAAVASHYGQLTVQDARGHTTGSTAPIDDLDNDTNGPAATEP